jgi:hypothetical protein
MLGWLKSRRGRSAARALIQPYLNQSVQRGAVAASTWHEPYVIGFLSMLITVVARREVGELSAASLAAVQAKAWTDITGADGTLVGEEICFLSAGEDKAFDLGCRNAVAFFEAVLAQTALEAKPNDDPLQPAWRRLSDGEAALWRCYFDGFVGGRELVCSDSSSDMPACLS